MFSPPNKPYIKVLLQRINIILHCIQYNVHYCHVLMVTIHITYPNIGIYRIKLPLMFISWLYWSNNYSWTNQSPNIGNTCYWVIWSTLLVSDLQSILMFTLLKYESTIHINNNLGRIFSPDLRQNGLRNFMGTGCIL